MAQILKVPRDGATSSTSLRLTKRFKKTRKAGAWLALLFVSLAITVIISPGFYLPAAPPRVGDLWMEGDVVSPFAFTVADPEAVEHHRSNRTSEAHPRVFVLNTTVEDAARQKLNSIFTLLQSASEDGPTTASEVSEELRRRVGIHLSDAALETLIEHRNNERVRADLEALLHHFYSARAISVDKHLFAGSARARRAEVEIFPRNDESVSTPSVESVLEYPREVFGYLDRAYLPEFSLSLPLQHAYGELARQLLRPNLHFDESLTQARRQAAQRAIATVQIRAGERLVMHAEPVTRAKAVLLDGLYTKLRQYNLLKSFGDAVFVVLAVLFMLLYARKYNPQISFTASNVTMVALPVIFGLSIARLVLNTGDASHLAAFAFPAGMIGMLCVILFDAQFALVLVTLSSLLFGVAAEMNFLYILVSIIGGFTGVASLYTIKERKEVMMAGIRLALVNFVAILAAGLVMHPERLDLAAAIGGIVNGIACYVLTVGALPVFETLFRVTTDVRLIELTSTNHPLLRMMEDKAPGSFQHALSVSSLAEPAAEEIGANYLLVRAGSYFHDIGKTLKPKYYIENQVTPEERKIHSKLSPYMSNLIIKNHVKDGIELARKHRLPEKVIDFIAQHQGTGLIKFFYNQALQKAEANDVVHEEEFRYPGPKPQTIEAAIVMLADTVEATATAKFANKTIDEDDLRKLVRDSILDKFHDGQFDECHMTFRDLHQISESFVQTLRSRYHHRIDYPEAGPRREIKDITRTSIERTTAASALRG